MTMTTTPFAQRLRGRLLSATTPHAEFREPGPTAPDEAWKDTTLGGAVIAVILALALLLAVAAVAVGPGARHAVDAEAALSNAAIMGSVRR
jgi:hypothetical protein